MTNKIKDGLMIFAFLVGIAIIFGIAGRGDYEVAKANQCWNATHSAACANQ